MSFTLRELIGGFVFGSAAWLIANRIYYALRPQRRKMTGNPTSLIDRLRAYPQTARNAPPCHEAANEIERLRAVVDALTARPFRGTSLERRDRMYGSDWEAVHDALDALEAHRG